MIVRPANMGISRLFVFNKGTVIHAIAGRLSFVFFLSLIATFTDGWIYHYKVTMLSSAFLLIGLPLSIFLGFRNSVSYQRFWEGRTLWGELINVSRNLCRQTLSLPADVSPEQAQALTYRVIAFVYSLKNHLRQMDQKDYTSLAPYLSPAELQQVERSRNQPNMLLKLISQGFAQLYHDHQVPPHLMAKIDDQITRLSYILGGCERVKSTPIPYSYLLLMHRTVFIYCILLPYALVDEVHYLTPLLELVLAYTFFGLDAVGDEIEDPFDADANDLPLNALSRNIEINLREMLDDPQLPEQIQPNTSSVLL